MISTCHPNFKHENTQETSLDRIKWTESHANNFRSLQLVLLAT